MICTVGHRNDAFCLNVCFGCSLPLRSILESAVFFVFSTQFAVCKRCDLKVRGGVSAVQWAKLLGRPSEHDQVQQFLVLTSPARRCPMQIDFRHRLHPGESDSFLLQRFEIPCYSHRREEAETVVRRPLLAAGLGTSEASQYFLSNSIRRPVACDPLLFE